MRSFERILQTEDKNPGNLIDIEANVDDDTYPSIYRAERRISGTDIEKKMSIPGEFQQILTGEGQKKKIMYTKNASGGCIPICAAEITIGESRIVEWIYLIHANGGNNPMDITSETNHPENIYVCILVPHEGGPKTIERAISGQDEFINALDPEDRIPDKNALLIWGPQTALAITPEAQIGVARELFV